MKHLKTIFFPNILLKPNPQYMLTGYQYSFNFLGFIWYQITADKQPTKSTHKKLLELFLLFIRTNIVYVFVSRIWNKFRFYVPQRDPSIRTCWCPGICFRIRTLVLTVLHTVAQGRSVSTFQHEHTGMQFSAKYSDEKYPRLFFYFNTGSMLFKFELIV